MGEGVFAEGAVAPGVGGRGHQIRILFKNNYWWGVAGMQSSLTLWHGCDWLSMGQKALGGYDN